MLLSMWPPAKLSGSAISFLEIALWGSTLLGSIKTILLQMCQKWLLTQARLSLSVETCFLLDGINESDRGTFGLASILPTYLKSLNHFCQIDWQRKKRRVPDITVVVARGKFHICIQILFTEKKKKSVNWPNL